MTITLSNQAGSTDYNLDVTVSPDENANSAPYFEESEWQEAQIAAVPQGEQVDHQLPQPYDDEYDDVSITVDTDAIRSFASWDDSSNTLSLWPDGEVDATLYRAKVTLDDGRLTTNYTLTILVEPSLVDEPTQDGTSNSPNSTNSTNCN